jgi:ABC-type Zn uptake system ZnuABC Zn-binding protein ZnuA
MVISVFGFLLALALVTGCASANDESKLTVVATTTQLGDFVRNVGGDHVRLTVLLKANQDAHDFAPTPSQQRALAQADIVFRNGIGLDTFVNKALQGSSAAVRVTTDEIALREAEEEGHAEEGDDLDRQREAAGRDPHVWFSVDNARKMVISIKEALQREDTTNSLQYEENARRYLGQLDQLDSSIRAQVASIPAGCRKLVTNHDVLGYYAAAFGFDVVGSAIPSVSTEAQASAADVAEVVRKIRAERVPAVFAEASVNPALIRQIGREAGVRVVDDLYGDSLGPAGSDGATYIKMMQSNSAKIAGALQGCSS